MRYLVQSSKKHKHYTYQRRWPSNLQEAALAAGYGSLCKLPTTCPVGSSELEMAEARELLNKEYDRIVALLRVADKAPTGITVVGPKGGLAGQLRKGAKRSAVQKAIPKHDVFGLLGHYHLANPEDGKAKKLRERCWSTFCDYMGVNVAATSKAMPTIHEGLDKWQEAMEQQGLKGTSIERQRNSVTAVLNWANLRYRLDWHLKPRPITKAKAKPKQILTVDEQKRLLEAVVSSPSLTASMLPLMLAGGVMPSEIGRLDVAELERTLNASQPYVVIGGKGEDVKADARRRVIPLVWPEPVIAVMREWLPKAAVRAANSSDPTAVTNKWLKARDFGVTGHGLRHTMAAMAGAAMANSLALARVGGWSGSGLNPVMLGYGTGMEDSELVASLAAEVSRWWRPVLPEEGLRLVATGS